MILNISLDTFKETIDLKLFYSSKNDPKLIGYADAGYLSDLHKVHSQNNYFFTYSNTIISWCFTKQTMILR